MSRTANKLYKNKYNICIYGPLKDGEPLIALLDNAYEFAEFMEINLNNAKVILFKAFKKEIRFIRAFNSLCTIEFLELN